MSDNQDPFGFLIGCVLGVAISLFFVCMAQVVAAETYDLACLSLQSFHQHIALITTERRMTTPPTLPIQTTSKLVVGGR